MGIITTIFEVVGEVVTGFLGVLSNLFDGVVSLFWTTGAEGTGGEMTILGTLLLIGVATPLVFWGINYIVKFFKSLFRK